MASEGLLMKYIKLDPITILVVVVVWNLAKYLMGVPVS